MPNKNFTLEDFINTPSKSTTIAVSSPKYELANNLNKSITLKDLSLSASKAEKFKKQIVEYVTSPESIKSVSDIVGAPLDNETENEFVERSLQNIKKLLLKKFG